MKKMVLGCAATAALLLVAAPAQDVPKLSEFLLTCSRDSAACRLKLKDYVTAASSQKSICLPKDVSTGEGASAMLRWLRSDDTSAALKDAPFDDALYEAATKLYPCASAPPPEAPAAPPADQPPAGQPPAGQPSVAPVPATPPQ